MEISPEQIKIQEIEAMTWMPWWQYLIEDFQELIEQNEEFIHDINVPDTPTHSQRSIYIAQVNCLRAMIEKPSALIQALKSVESKK